MNHDRDVVVGLLRDAALPLSADELEVLVAAYPAHRQVVESMYAVPLTADEAMHLSPTGSSSSAEHPDPS